MKLQVCGYTRESVVDGPGIRAVVFAQGCPHHCQGCHNPDTWNFEEGYELDGDQILEQIKNTRSLRGVTFSGGEPFSQARAFASLAESVKSLGLDIMTYTGYSYEDLLAMSENDNGVKTLLHNTDILVDGSFKEEEKDYSLAFRGSRNQRIINVPASLSSESIVLMQFD
ncbi:MAG: anaerobic ribonucleoside-triphosphate reductase activating protein [Chitinophagales bacterium]